MRDIWRNQIVIKRIKITHICIVIVVLCIIAALTNCFLQVKYKEAFEAEEEHVEDGKSNLLISKDGVFNYRIEESSGTVELIAYNKEDKSEIKIPEKIDGQTVTSIGETAFAYHTELNLIYIPKTINTVRLAFVAGCNNLDKIIFEGDVEEIEDYAFSDFTGKIVASEKSHIYSYGKKYKIQVEAKR